MSGITSAGLEVTVERDGDHVATTIGDIDADDVVIVFETGGNPSSQLTMQPGQTSRSTAAGATSVKAIARKDGNVVAITFQAIP